MIREIIFQRDEDNPEFAVPGFHPEMEAMKAIGIPVGFEPSDNAEQLFLRHCIIWNQDEFPEDDRFQNNWRIYQNTSRMSIFLPLIEDLSIPSVIVDRLDNNVIETIQRMGWEKAFIKNEVKSLWNMGEMASVWPDTPLEQMIKEYEKRRYNGKYVIRQFIDPKIFYNEERYWVLNGRIFHRSGIIPPEVQEAAKRLEVLGSLYYTIDAVDGMIVEINPGVSSDRHGDNSSELFASWWKAAFF